MFAEDHTDERQVFQLFAYGCDLNSFECFCLLTKSNKDAVKQIGLRVRACADVFIFMCKVPATRVCVYVRATILANENFKALQSVR